MAILEALGINSTTFIQFFLFIFTIAFLSQFAFKHYAQALDLRDKKTIGGEELAAETHKKTADLTGQYEARARQVNGEIKKIFDNYREEATKEYETVVSRARAESQKTIESARQKVSSEINDAAKKLKEEAPILAQAITKKLLTNDKGLA